MISCLIELAQVIKYPGIDGVVMPLCIVVGGVDDQSAEIRITLETIGSIVGDIE